jgi:hypothetical protein
MKNTFAEELSKLINRFMRESNSDTPDFILAQYLDDCLAAYEKASKRREQWYGKGLRIDGIVRIDPNTGKDLGVTTANIRTGVAEASTDEDGEDRKTWD